MGGGGMNENLSGKTVVITGASRGLGLAMAQAFGTAGAAVVIGSRSAAAIAAAVQELQRQGMSVSGIACDVSRPSELAALADHARKTFGGFDVWINNAGISTPYGPTAEIDPSKFEQVVATNILGVYHGSMVALREFLPRGTGKLINLLGRGDRSPAPFQSGYTSSKVWVRSFTLALASEYRHSGVGIFAFNPGLVRTDMLLEPEAIAGWEDRLQGFFGFIVNAWAAPPEVPAGKAVWLAGRATDGKTGKVVSLVGSGTILGRSLRWSLRRLAGRAPVYPIRTRTVPSYLETHPLEKPAP
jgi:NAD(P)-dependent dehydrogenase (short-subunit alcohol dehydrogenase family)